MNDKPHGCEDCHFYYRDVEYGDYGTVYSDNHICTKREEMEERTDFPLAVAPSECFIVDFWSSEFTDEIDGSDESVHSAMEKWKAKHLHAEANTA